MLQPILSLLLVNDLSQKNQLVIGIIYNLVKYTAPAFIFGIIYTLIRSSDQQKELNIKKYAASSWHNLFLPSIVWTFIYLLLMPNLQQGKPYNSPASFCWQFINGNAAPHLWYNTMMLQFILLFPLFFQLNKLLKQKPQLIAIVFWLTLLFYLGWLAFYDHFVFHGIQQNDWYLLDRVFISFIIYGIYGLLAWRKRQYYRFVAQKYWHVFAFMLLVTFCLTNFELEQFGYPVNLNNAPYYKPSMTFYSLFVIIIISAFFFKQQRQKRVSLAIFHFLATYAYRAYLANVFFLQLFWQLFSCSHWAGSNPLSALLILYPLIWLASFFLAIISHKIWQRIRRNLLFFRK